MNSNKHPAIARMFSEHPLRLEPGTIINKDESIRRSMLRIESVKSLHQIPSRLGITSDLFSKHISEYSIKQDDALCDILGKVDSDDIIPDERSLVSIFIDDFKQRIKKEFKVLPMFINWKPKDKKFSSHLKWIASEYERFCKDTKNDYIANVSFLSNLGYVFCMEYSPDGKQLVVGFSTGYIELRNGITGVVLCTLRNIQVPPQPVYNILWSTTEERVCYAVCEDGIIYRIEVPNMTVEETKEEALPYGIRADPALSCLATQFYKAPGLVNYSTPFIIYRSPALSFAMSPSETKIVAGYNDWSVRLYDKETQNVLHSYKLIKGATSTKKTQRLHANQVCALTFHPEQELLYASGSWDNTVRIWDTRCKLGCVCTFEGVNVCANSIDLHRNELLVGSWLPTEALTVWDLRAKKQISVVRVQNRRPNVDGEYIYACRFWKSKDFNRKGKYALVGGSGTEGMEVINLHNRYIACSYPCQGSILAVTSYNERIAFGGTEAVIHIATFHDPKHEKSTYKKFDTVVDPVWTKETDVTAN